MQKKLSLLLCLLPAFFAVGQAGVGISLQDGKLFPQVSGISPGSPAELAGIPLNGVVMRINGEDAFLMKAKVARNRLEGPPGSTLNLIITGIYRTDTFNITRMPGGKTTANGPGGKLCTALGSIFTLLQKAPEKLQGTIIKEGLHLSTRTFPEALQCYSQTDTTKSGVEPVFRAVMARSENPENLDDLDKAFQQLKPMLDNCFMGWHSSIKKDETYQVNFDNYTWKKGNTIVHLSYNPRNKDLVNPGYTLDLRIVSVR